ncbi:MAG: phage baseplate assembly protein W [Flavobacteriales bacterium]|jgi:phage baseplate assembly protein W
MENNSFLGKGWSFPPSFDQLNSEVVMVSKEEDIYQSLKIILSTTPGERIMRPKFGCDLNQFVYEERSESLFSRIKETIMDALIRFEPRIDVEAIFIELDHTNDGLLFITIDYFIRQTNSRQNMVYPFYMLEGNNLAK